MRQKRSRLILAFGLLLLLSLVIALPAAARPQPPFPDLIPLPNGSSPEGIAIGRGTNFYAGSLADGSVFAGDLRTGRGGVLVPPQDGRIAVGMDVDERSNYLFVAGGPAGAAYVYDLADGSGLATYQLTTEPATFVNDVILTREAAYFSDSFRPYFYKVPLGPGGALPDPADVQEIALGAGFDFEPGQFNANGIEATANGRHLILVNSFFGSLYRVDPHTGAANQIDLGNGAVPSGDGLLRDGQTLYVVQNFLNQIAVVRLAPDLSRGTVIDTITDPAFRIPTTADDFGNTLYAVNARFDTPPGPNVEYEVVAVPK
jgi:hypothetical protein